MKKFTSILCLLFVFVMLLSIPMAAAKTYQTYTYSIDGKALYSPDAYTAQKTIDAAAMGLDLSLLNASDMAVDGEGNVYISDTGNNRILCLDRYYRLRFEISTFMNGEMIMDKFSKPRGLFVTEDRYEGKDLKYPGRIFVCDTEAKRIVTFNLDGTFHSIIDEPQSELFEDGSVYWPVAIAVDSYDRLFVVSSETNEGVIVMTDEGVFTGFIGAQQSVSSVWDQIWRRFQSKEQREQSETVISYPYNNVDINENGFIYATIYNEKLKEQMASAITAQSTAGTYAPCKLLNPAGDEIMRRNGFWPPAGEIDFQNQYVDPAKKNEVSRVEDVACGPEKTWSIIDINRSKIYTYDYDGNLLFAFGDTGTQLGNLSAIKAIAYQGDTMLVLDGDNANQKIVVYNRTEYGDVLISALRYQNDRQYDEAIDAWKEILMRNSNYDAAYIGIGNSLFRENNFEEALENYKAAYDVDNYSIAYKELRGEWMSRFFLLIPVVIVVAVILISKFLKYANKINKRAAVSGGKRTFKEELMYVFHVMFHPFDGFWDLKHEKRGSVRAALVFMGITVIGMFYRSVGVGYVMNPKGEYSTIFMQFLVVVVPVFLFAIANWCLTTLFEGEGSLRDVIVAVGYSLLPLPLTMIPTTFFSNYIVMEETDLLGLLVTIGFIWAGFLIFFGTMVTHDYPMGKNVLTVLGTIVGMAFIMFLAILFTSLIMDIVTFITNYVSEVVYRL
ncbi:MAG: YIP1 family protein [Clostridia bacterium]|nr:YIP1 family protein [Clostridia bacterium]